jgi:hypothetical protein
MTSKITQQGYGFRADPDYIELVDDIIALSRLGLTSTTYKDRSNLFLTGIAGELNRFIEAELRADPVLGQIFEAIMAAHNGYELLGMQDALHAGQ